MGCITIHVCCTAHTHGERVYCTYVVQYIKQHRSHTWRKGVHTCTYVLQYINQHRSHTWRKGVHTCTYVLQYINQHRSHTWRKGVHTCTYVLQYINQHRSHTWRKGVRTYYNTSSNTGHTHGERVYICTTIQHSSHTWKKGVCTCSTIHQPTKYYPLNALQFLFQVSLHVARSGMTPIVAGSGMIAIVWGN